METEKFTINVEKLQNQVKYEVLADEKYQRENSAKLRAIEQRVPTYEDFRQMVLASNLKPLDKGESLKENMSNGAKVWNSIADSNKSLSDYQIDLEREKILNLENTVPRSNLEFVKIWKQIEEKYDDEIKWNFLYNLKIQKMQQLFQMEINGELLGKFLILFQNHLQKIENFESDLAKTHLDYILDLLKLFPKCNRFSLNFMFLKPTELDACKTIFKILDENKIELSNLKKSYFK